MKLRSVYLSCVIALVLAARATGQSELYKQWLDDNAQANKAETAEESARKAKEQQALKLLDQAIAEAITLKAPENRIHILAVASGLVWPRDEKRARELLKSAADSFSDIIASLDTTDPVVWNRAGQLFRIKSELFHTALRYDPASALDFLHRTRTPGMTDQDAQLEADAAWQLVNTDPQMALKIAEQSLANGITGNLPGIASQLRAKDPVAAQKLASDILNKIQSDDFAANNQSFWLALNMIQTSVQSVGAQAAADGTAGASAMLLAPSDLKALLTRVVSTSITLGKAGFVYGGEWQMARNALNQIQSMLPQIEKLDPQLSAKIAGQISPLLQAPRPASNPGAVLQNLVENGTPDEVVKAADSAPAQMKDQYFQQAAWKALNQGDVDKAAQIARQNVANPVTRQQILDQIEQRSAWQAMNEGKIDEARILISRIRPREQRAQAFVNLANNVMEHGDKKTAAGLLDEARAALPDTPESYYHVSLLLSIAGAYSRVDPSQGIQIMNSIAALLGRLIPAAETLQGFDVQATFKDGEILMEPSSQLSSAMAQFAEQLGNLATSDYGAAVIAADSAGRPELRIMADLSIASKVLNEAAQYGQSRPIAGRGYNGYVQLR